MPAAATFDLSGLEPSSLILGTLFGLGALAGVLFWSGLLGVVIQFLYDAVLRGIQRGFHLWRLWFSWAPWPVFLALVVGQLVLGASLVDDAPALAVLLGLGPLVMGVSACLAYIFIERERYEVERGYKSVFKPLHGQELAHHVIRYGHRVGLFLLASSAIAFVGGFALLNQGLCASVVGASWYEANDAGFGFSDFLAYALINLYNLVDLLNVAASKQLLRVPHIEAIAWPAKVLLNAFKVFFTFVLLQQLFASVRAGRLLGETIDDFWSPHEPIHLRARGALPLHGLTALSPLLASLRARDTLTKEQRDRLPSILAEIGPAIVPFLRATLRDRHEHVRAVTVAALGQLQAVEALPALLMLRDDASPLVRQNLVEALGLLASSHHVAVVQPRVGMRNARVRWWVVVQRWWVLRRLPANPVPLVVECLCATLQDSSPIVRLQAAAALGKIGPVAVEAAADLRTLLGDADETVRCQAADALGAVRAADEATLAALVALLDDGAAGVRTAAARTLGQLEGAAAPALSALAAKLHDGEETVRKTVAEAIAKIGTLPDGAMDTLVAGLGNRDNLIRAQTARALGTIGSTAAEAAPALVDAMQDSNDAVRAEVVEALGKLGPAAADVAVTPMIRALHDPDSWVSALAAEALGAMGESAEEAAPALIRSLRHVSAQVRANAAEALGKMGAAAMPARDALMQALRDEDGGVRCQALRALAELPAEGEDVLRTALADADPNVRAAAAQTAGHWAPLSEETLGILVGLLEDASDAVKVEAARGLPRLVGATGAVIEGLCQRLLNDDSPWVQGQAAQALGQLGAAAQAAGPMLLRAAQTADAAVREEALRALTRIQPAEAATAFLMALKDASADIRLIASAGWRRAAAIPEEAVAGLVDALHDPEVIVRVNAAHALSRLDTLPAGAAPVLAELFVHPNDALRLHAALALRLAPEQVPALKPLLDDPNARVRLVVAQAMLKHADGAAALGVIAQELTSPQLNCRKAAVRLVAELGPQASPLREALEAQAACEENSDIKEELRSLIAKLPAKETAAPVETGTPSPVRIVDNEAAVASVSG